MPEREYYSRIIHENVVSLASPDSFVRGTGIQGNLHGRLTGLTEILMPKLSFVAASSNDNAGEILKQS